MELKKEIENKKNKIKQKFLTLALLVSTTLFPLKLDAELTSSNKLYVYNTTRNILISQEPYWFKDLENVCEVQFADYINKKNEKVPVLFVAYKSGKAGFYVLPVNGENEYLYYEFNEKFKTPENGRCYIFDGIEKNKKNNQKILYFRVVEQNGETKNYGIPYGMF